MAAKENENLYDTLEKVCPKDHLDDFHRILYGGHSPAIALSQTTANLSKKHDFEVKAFQLGSTPKEQNRAPRIVRIAAIQHSIVASTSAPVLEQYKAMEDKVRIILDAAGAQGVNVVCLQEAWTCPFFFCTRERTPWLEFAEDAETGASTVFLQEMARKHNMVIVNPILERDSIHGDTLWNTCVVIGNNGNVIGKSRKNHIPRVGDFNESTYYREGDDGHPVFDTAFGKIGINICYGRHFGQNWQQYALNGAEIIFNPSATTAGLSETFWPIEARAAAVWNSCFTVGINRVGSESFPNEYTSGDGKKAHKTFGPFYGSSFITGPTGQRTPPLSRTRDGLIVAEVDLNRIRQIKDSWGFQMNAHHDIYARKLANYCEPDFEPELIVDPAKTNGAVNGTKDKTVVEAAAKRRKTTH